MANSTLRLGAQMFRVSVVKDLRDENNAKMMGDFEASKTLIRLDAAQSVESGRLTLMHEILHALNNQCEIRMNERQTDALAASLIGLLRDNPLLVKTLVETGDYFPFREAKA